MYRLIAVAAVALSAGCAQPLHLQYDFGRAYMTTFNLQADLTRPSVAHSNYFLYGSEAAQIRLNAEKATTDEKDDSATVNMNAGGGS